MSIPPDAVGATPPRFVKCLCQYCNGHVEFDATRAGEVVACPHCGLETRLYIPQVPIGLPQLPQTPNPASPAAEPASPAASTKAFTPSEVVTYLVLLEGKQQGPYTLRQIRAMWDTGRLTLQMQYRTSERDEWKPLASMLLAIEPAQPPPIIGRKKCPYCGGEIPFDALKCSHCGSKVLAKPPVTGLSPIVVALASAFCIAGLGQFLVGQTAKGLVLMLVCIVASVLTYGLALLILWPLMGVDAYMVAQRQQEGKLVGPWEFFPSKSAAS